MMDEAIKCVVEAQDKLLLHCCKERLRLGYARAGRLIDEMEQMGVVVPMKVLKPRQVLITYQQWLEMTMQKRMMLQMIIQKNKRRCAEMAFLPTTKRNRATGLGCA